MLQDKSQGEPSPSIELEKKIDFAIPESILNENTEAQLDITLAGKQEVVEGTNSGNLINDVISTVNETLVTESANLSDEIEHFKNDNANGSIETDNLTAIDAINPEVTDCIDELIESVVKAKTETDDRLMETIPKESEFCPTLSESAESDKAAVIEDKMSNISAVEEPNDVAETKEVLLTNSKNESESSENSIENMNSPETISLQETLNSSEHPDSVKSESITVVELEQEEISFVEAVVKPSSSKYNMQELRNNQAKNVNKDIEDGNNISDNDLKPSHDLEEVTSTKSAEALTVSDKDKIASEDFKERVELQTEEESTVENFVNEIVVVPDNDKVITNEPSSTAIQEESLIETNNDEIRSDELECTIELVKDKSAINLSAENTNSESHDDKKVSSEVNPLVEIVQNESSIKSVPEQTNSNYLVEEVLQETSSLVVENISKPENSVTALNEQVEITTRVSGIVEVTKTDSHNVVEDQKPKENLNLQEENNQATQELLAVTSKMVESSSVESNEVPEKHKSICARETTNTTIAARPEFIVDSIKTEAGQDLTGSLCQPVRVQVSKSSRQKILSKQCFCNFLKLK